MVPTPTSQDHIERQNTNKTPSTGKLNYETNKSVSLDRWVKMWPTPSARETGGGGYQDPEKIKARMDKGHQTNSCDAVKLWPTPRVSMANGPSAKEVAQGNPKRRLETEVELWPTPTKQDASNNGGPSQHKRNSLPLNTAVLYPTPSVQEPGWKNLEIVDKDGNPPTHANQRFYDKKTGRVVQKGLQQVVTDPKSGGKLNPQWVAWLMGYPTEYLNSVPWETRSSRRSRKK